MEPSRHHVLTSSTKLLNKRYHAMQNTNCRLLYACEIRLRIHIREKSQRNVLQFCKNTETVFDEILKIMNMNSIISCFQIMYCLQREVIKLLRIKPTHIYQTPELIHITICYALGINELLVQLAKRFTKTWQCCKLQCQSEKFSEDDAHSRQKTAIGNQVPFIYFNKWLLNMQEEMKRANQFKTDETSKLIGISSHELVELAQTSTVVSSEDALEMCYRVREFHHLLMQNHKSKANIYIEEKHSFNQYQSYIIHCW